MRKTTFSTQSHFHGFPLQILINSKIFKLSLNLSFRHLRALKEDLSPVNIFHDSFENFKITRICMENHARVSWMAKVVFFIQMLSTFGGCCNSYFWDMRLKILRLPNFNMLFQLVLTKFFKSELFPCLPSQVDQVMKRTYWRGAKRDGCICRLANIYLYLYYLFISILFIYIYIIYLYLY